MAPRLPECLFYALEAEGQSVVADGAISHKGLRALH